MSSSIDAKTVSSASKAGIVSSKVVEAIAPVISEVLIENMEKETRAKKGK